MWFIVAEDEDGHAIAAVSFNEQAPALMGI
jgi:hypothetical protein